MVSFLIEAGFEQFAFRLFLREFDVVMEALVPIVPRHVIRDAIRADKDAGDHAFGRTVLIVGHHFRPDEVTHLERMLRDHVVLF